MATASGNPMDMLEKELSCSICLNLLREPKDLDCAHTYCLGCLKQYVQKKSTIDCPDCRNITIVPQGGLANLKTNLRIKNVVENIIQGTGQISSKKQKEVLMCPDHIGERQHFFCVTCNISVCRDCLVLKHPKPQHEIREWKEVMEEEEKQRRKKTKELDDVERELKSAKDKVKQEIKSRIHHATTEMKTWEKKMDQDIETMYQTRMKILQEKRKCLNRFVTSGMSKISIHDDELPHDMTILHLEPAQISSNFGKLVTTANKKLDTSTNQNQVGSANKELNLTLFTKFKTRAMHVAANQSDLIAVVTRGTRISVYGQYNGGYKEQCCLGLNNFPSSVAISSQGKFFVSDGGEVKIFSPAGNYEKAWPKSVDAGRIAIAPDNSIVIGRKSGDAITMYKCDGELIRRHPIKCSDMRGIASNGEQIAFTTPNTVCVIDFVTGHTLWTVSTASAPSGICYEHNSNTLLVARFPDILYQGVIEQYCSTTGRLISCQANNLYCPWGMTVTQDNKLVVADGNRVKIFNISS